MRQGQTLAGHLDVHQADGTNSLHLADLYGHTAAAAAVRVAAT